jgi:hypothetical protein
MWLCLLHAYDAHVYHCVQGDAAHSAPEVRPHGPSYWTASPVTMHGPRGCGTRHGPVVLASTGGLHVTKRHRQAWLWPLRAWVNQKVAITERGTDEGRTRYTAWVRNAAGGAALGADAARCRQHWVVESLKLRNRSSGRPSLFAETQLARKLRLG